jgi:hypothetical protein
MTSLSEYNAVLFLLNFFFLQSVQVGSITVSSWDPSLVEIRAGYTSTVPVGINLKKNALMSVLRIMIWKTGA